MARENSPRQLKLVEADAGSTPALLFSCVQISDERT
jgi:hypothetical protein